MRRVKTDKKVRLILYLTHGSVGKRVIKTTESEFFGLLQAAFV